MASNGCLQYTDRHFPRQLFFNMSKCAVFALACRKALNNGLCCQAIAENQLKRLFAASRLRCLTAFLLTLTAL
jgi:hypothetical protein